MYFCCFPTPPPDRPDPERATFFVFEMFSPAHGAPCDQYMYVLRRTAGDVSARQLAKQLAKGGRQGDRQGMGWRAGGGAGGGQR